MVETLAHTQGQGQAGGFYIFAHPVIPLEKFTRLVTNHVSYNNNSEAYGNRWLFEQAA